ncbi:MULTISPECIES: GNAT family N-acetyltransferase [Flavobacterium]|uniref:GNAT family N-acetyltransferase n=1 Tax=Flavobacterium TaxID=237 RepID=UPI001FCC9AC9|nr:MULTISPECIES: GNAT family N-acetyltransferase [Flavobacterium]UOK42281.1 GNAT family N-acetyltransferase [Flavobacterium enshiense]
MHTIVETTDLSKGQKLQLFELWNKEYPKKLCYETLVDFENYLGKLENKTHFLLTDENLKIVGWALLFERENETWFVKIIDASFQRKGFGQKLLERLKSKTNILNGWVIDHNNDKKSNGSDYKSPINFYIRNQFKINNTIRLELDIISAAKIEWTK